MKKTIIQTNKLCKSFQTGTVTQHVLKNLDLQLYEKDFTIIMGSSGSGKSTLLYALSGMDTATIGDVSLCGISLAGASNDQLAMLRRKHCGFIFQSIYLIETMNVLDNVLTSGLLVNSHKKQVADHAETLLKQVGLKEEDFTKYPNQLSGGERQRVAIVRSIINQPELLFADEPTGALNSAASSQVLDEFTRLNTQGQSIVLVTHDLKTALRGNRILYLKDGTVCGDLSLPLYSEDRLELRTAKLKQFLAEMGW